MKTTIDIADALLAEARVTGAREGTTLRSLVEAGLRAELARHRDGTTFRLRDGSVGGGWVRPEIVEGGWVRISEEIYREYGE